jgi:hypothetical protein
VHSRLAHLTARRRALVTESQALRAQLAGATSSVRQVLAPAQIGRALLSGLGRHPVLTVGIGVALVAIGPRRLWKLAALGGGGVVLALRVAPALAAAARLARPRRTGRMRH